MPLSSHAQDPTSLTVQAQVRATADPGPDFVRGYKTPGLSEEEMTVVASLVPWWLVWVGQLPSGNMFYGLNHWLGVVPVLRTSLSVLPSWHYCQL